MLANGWYLIQDECGRGIGCVVSDVNVKTAQLILAPIARDTNIQR
jgi:hypothetical protein